MAFLKQLYEKENNPKNKENRYLLMIMSELLYTTGARIGELKELRVSDFTHNYIDRTVENFSTIDIRNSKTLERKIIVSDSTAYALSRISLNWRVSKFRDDNPLLFMRHYDLELPNFTQILQSIKLHNKDFFRKNKLDDFVLYNLRHSFITRKLNEEMSLFDISQHCGTSVKMIEKHYSAYTVSSNPRRIYTRDEVSN
jgi:integrase